MDHNCLETFITIVSANSISKAADLLYITQSTVSKRLQILEEEVGLKLIIRDKGRRSIELTPAGVSFLPIAEQWVNLHKQMLNLRDGASRSTLAVASVDSLNFSVLTPVYRKLLEHNTEIELTVTTNQSVVIYEMLERHQYDVGFVLVKLQRPNILVAPFLTQQFRLIRYSAAGAPPAGPIHPESLNPALELFQPWGADYQQWHDYWWPTRNHYLKVDSVTMMQNLFQQDGFWTIVPDSIAELYRNTPHCYIDELQEPPPERVCYRIVSKHPRESCKAAMALFDQLLAEAYGFEA